jgi:hypothetical protein
VCPHAQTDPLPSWNDGPAKQAILAFVQATTDKASPQFVPPEVRIATFDQDGTTWVEHPMYTQVVYCLVLADTLRASARTRRSLRSQPGSASRFAPPNQAANEVSAAIRSKGLRRGSRS